MGPVSSRAVSNWSRSPRCFGLRGVYRVGRTFFVIFFFDIVLLRMHTACCKYEAILPLSTGVRTGCQYLISQSVCVCVCDIRHFYRVRELYEADFHKPRIYGSGRACANARGAFRHGLSRGGRGCWADVGFVVCFRWGGMFSWFP